jgi:uncharacterized protein involved in response to NO
MIRGALFSYGFRPFFVAAGLFAPLVLLALLLAFSGFGWPADAMPIYRWHGHEMILGFVAAAIAGFLLTAVPSWTGATPVAGARLVGLVAIWLAGRLVVGPLLGVAQTPWVLIDSLFFPALAVLIGLPLIGTRNVRNYPFLVLLTLLFATDALFHAEALGWMAPLGFDPLRLAIDIVVLMIVVVGGRIIPAFTHNALVRAGEPSAVAPRPWLERLSIALTAAIVAADVVVPDTAASGVVALLAGVAVAGRLAGWQGLRVLRMLIVIVLHVGFAWLCVALILKGVWQLTAVPWAANWLHVLTAGAFGTMILAVMSRVALGHTGRPLVVSRATTAAYVLVSVSAALRVWGPTAAPALAVDMLRAAIVLWGAAYAIFAIVYWPVLIRPRLQ